MMMERRLAAGPESNRDVNSTWTRDQLAAGEKSITLSWPGVSYESYHSEFNSILSFLFFRCLQQRGQTAMVKHNGTR